MHRLILILVALALVVAACSEAAAETSDSGTVNETAASNSASSKPTAPDFTLALEPSGKFVLSQEVKPVYMIFWAEW
jgi:ABC-type glycerol-3-phosphate transport system substrate-binding protein